MSNLWNKQFYNFYFRYSKQFLEFECMTNTYSQGLISQKEISEVREHLVNHFTKAAYLQVWYGCHQKLKEREEN